jgi:hypothetical protein
VAIVAPEELNSGYSTAILEGNGALLTGIPLAAGGLLSRRPRKFSGWKYLGAGISNLISPSSIVLKDAINYCVHTALRCRYEWRIRAYQPPIHTGANYSDFW